MPSLCDILIQKIFFIFNKMFISMVTRVAFEWNLRRVSSFLLLLTQSKKKGTNIRQELWTIYRSFKTISFCVNATGEMNRSNKSERTILWIERILFSYSWMPFPRVFNLFHDLGLRRRVVSFGKLAIVSVICFTQVLNPLTSLKSTNHIKIHKKISNFIL